MDNIRIIIASFVISLCFLESVFPQLAKAEIKDNVELLNVLMADYRNRQSEVTKILAEHRHYVDHNLWNKLIDRAAWSYHSGNSKEAFYIYSLAASVAEHLENGRLLATTHYYVGRAHSGLGQIEQSVQAYQRSLKAFEDAHLMRDVIYVLSDLGSLYLILEDYDKAKLYSERSIELANKLQNNNVEVGAYPDQFGVARAISNLGNIHVWQGDYVQALRQLKVSLSLYRELNGGGMTYSPFVAETLTDIGYVYSAVGDNIRALSYLSEALGIAKTLPNKIQEAYVLNSLGTLYLEQEDYTEALKCFERCSNIYLTQGNKLEVARVSLNIGTTHLRLGNYDTALDSYQKVLNATENIGLVILAEQTIGAVYLARGDKALASEWLKRSLASAEKIKNPVRITEAIWRLAEVAYASGDYSNSIKLASDAVMVAYWHKLTKHSYLALTAQGKAYRANKNYEQAYTALHHAIGLVEQLRGNAVGGDQGRQKFLENSIAPYLEMFLLLIEQGRVAEALQYAERAKGRALLEVLRNGRTDITKSMTAEERDEEQKLNREITALNTQITRENSREKTDQVKLDQLLMRLEKARQAHELFLTNLYAVHPDLRRQRGIVPVATTTQLGALIPDKNFAALEFVVTEGKTYLIVLTKREMVSESVGGELELQMYPLAVTAKDLAVRVSKFREQIANRRIVAKRDYQQLYDLLLKPAERQLVGKKTLCIVPDGALWELPFQTLNDGTKFLIEDRAIFYAPSLSVLHEMSKYMRGAEKAHTERRSLLAFANPSLGVETVQKVELAQRGKKLAPLPEAETEVRTAARLFSPSQNKVYIGAEALERRAKAEAGKHTVLHFATHGLLDDRNPMYSYLVLAQTNNSGEEDGLLEAREIMNLNLNADLVVLSACETGLGRFSAGEGVIGMTWAFFVAGAPSTVASLWSVESASTSQLMVEFHRQLRAANLQLGDIPAKAAALQQAQLKLLRSERFDHPFYWAGFSLYGDPQ